MRKFDHRCFFRTPFPPLANVDALQKDKYDVSMKNAIESATLLKSLEQCDKIHSNMHQLIQNQNRFIIADCSCT